MAFASANIRKVDLGSNLHLFVGDWTCDDGDADGEMTFRGSQCYLKLFSRGTSTEYGDYVPVSDAAGSADGTRTLTIPCKTVCAAGKFVVLTAG